MHAVLRDLLMFSIDFKLTFEGSVLYIDHNKQNICELFKLNFSICSKHKLNCIYRGVIFNMFLLSVFVGILN